MPSQANKSSTLNNASDTVNTDDVAVRVLTNEPSSSLGPIVVSHAAQALLKELNLQSSCLLGWHQMSEGNAIDLLGQAVASKSLMGCCPIVTTYDTDLGPVQVVTEACNDGVNRVKTRLSLPLEH
jgi:hypothetical protein